MKRIILLSIIFSVLAPISVLASALSLSMHDGAYFHIDLDNRTYHQASDQFMLEGLDAGEHFLTVYRHESGHRGQMRIRQVFSGVIRIPPNTRVFSQIDQRGRYRVVHKQHLQPVPVGHFVLSPAEFTRVRTAMLSTFSDAERLRIARKAIRHHRITSTQAGLLMEILNMENSRVKLAKFAYPRVVDKGNFRTVYSYLAYTSSVRKVENYIRNYGH